MVDCPPSSSVLTASRFIHIAIAFRTLAVPKNIRTISLGNVVTIVVGSRFNVYHQLIGERCGCDHSVQLPAFFNSSMDVNWSSSMVD